MPENPMHQHIASAASRSVSETRRLAERLLAQSWPGGAVDRTEPSARAWLKQWRPARFAASVPVCGCADGRCTVCN